MHIHPRVHGITPNNLSLTTQGIKKEGGRKALEGGGGVTYAAWALSREHQCAASWDGVAWHDASTLGIKQNEVQQEKEALSQRIRRRDVKITRFGPDDPLEVSPVIEFNK